MSDDKLQQVGRAICNTREHGRNPCGFTKEGRAFTCSFGCGYTEMVLSMARGAIAAHNAPSAREKSIQAVYGLLPFDSLPSDRMALAMWLVDVFQTAPLQETRTRLLDALNGK